MHNASLIQMRTSKNIGRMSVPHHVNANIRTSIQSFNPL